MSYTIVTETGTPLWRDDLFATEAEAAAVAARQPVTAAGHATLVVTSEQARLIRSESQRIRRNHEVWCERALRRMVAAVVQP